MPKKTKPFKYQGGAKYQTISLDPELHKEWIDHAKENHLSISEIAVEGIKLFLLRSKRKGKPDARKAS